MRMTDTSRNYPKGQLQKAPPARTLEEARDAIIVRANAAAAWRANHPDAAHEHRQRLAREGRDI